MDPGILGLIPNIRPMDIIRQDIETETEGYTLVRKSMSFSNKSSQLVSQS